MTKHPEGERSNYDNIDPRAWAIHVDRSVLRELEAKFGAEKGIFPGITSELVLTKYVVPIESEVRAAQGCTFYVDEEGVLRQLFQHVFPTGYDASHSLMGGNVLFASSILYFPEKMPFTHSEGPTVSMSCQAEMKPQAFPFTDINAKVLTVGSSLLYQPLRNYPSLGLKPSYGELRTSSSLLRHDHSATFANAEREGVQRLDNVTAEFEVGEGNHRKVTLDQQVSSQRVVIDLNVETERFMAESLLMNRPVFPVRIDFEKKK